MRYAVLDVDRDGSCRNLVFGDIDFDKAGLAVDGLLLVKDKIADTIIDVAPAIALNGL